MRKPIRVLHVVGAMNHGGVESWLMALLRHADRSEVAMDFVVHTRQPAAYDAEIVALGAKVFSCGPVHRPGYIHDFNNVLRTYGPYDALHSHVHYFSGVTTAIARRHGIPLRIAHSHSDSSVPESHRGLLRAGYRLSMRRAMSWAATDLLAASRLAAAALFGRLWTSHPRAKILYCGVDFGSFARTNPLTDRTAARQELGIHAHDVVIGHVGSFGPPKNHAFLCSVAQAAARQNRNVCVVCVGAGPLQHEIRGRFQDAGIRAIFPGLRTDIPRLLRAMDAFVFPSLYEGLPLAVIEAQAAGLPCLLSTAVTREVDCVPGLIRWLPLSAGADVWAATALEAAQQRAQSAEALTIMRRSPFSVGSSFEQMRSVYQTCAQTGRARQDSSEPSMEVNIQENRAASL